MAVTVTITGKDKSKQAIKQTEKNLRAFSNRVIGFSKKMQQSWGKISRTIKRTALVAGVAIVALATKAIKAFTTQAQSIAGMEQVLRSMGRYTGEFSKQIRDIAAQIETKGIIGDEAIIEGTKFLLTYRAITDELMPRTMKAMADFAALTGGDVAMAANILGKASMGMTGMLSRYGITLSEASKKSKKFKDILFDIETQIKGQNRALAEAAGGGFKQFRNVIGTSLEILGEMLTLKLEPRIRAWTKAIGEWIEKGGMKEFASNLANIFEKILGLAEKIGMFVKKIVENVNKIEMGKLEQEIMTVAKAITLAETTGKFFLETFDSMDAMLITKIKLAREYLGELQARLEKLATVSTVKIDIIPTVNGKPTANISEILGFGDIGAREGKPKISFIEDMKTSSFEAVAEISQGWKDIASGAESSMSSAFSVIQMEFNGVWESMFGKAQSVFAKMAQSFVSAMLGALLQIAAKYAAAGLLSLAFPGLGGITSALTLVGAGSSAAGMITGSTGGGSSIIGAGAGGPAIPITGLPGPVGKTAAPTLQINVSPVIHALDQKDVKRYIVESFIPEIEDAVRKNKSKLVVR